MRRIFTDSRESCGSINLARSCSLPNSTHNTVKKPALAGFCQGCFLSFSKHDPGETLKFTAVFLSLFALISSCIAAANNMFSELLPIFADATFIIEVAQALHRFGLKEIFNFVYSPCTQIFPDLIAAYVTSFFSHNVYVVATVMLVVQIGIMLGGAFYFFNVVLAPGKKLLACSVMFLCVAFALIIQTKVNTFTFHPVSIANHYCAFILALPISGLCLAWLNRGGKIRIIMMGSLLFLANLSAPSALPFVTAPLLIYLAYYFLKFDGQSRKASFFVGATALLTSLVGAMTARYILPSNTGFGSHPIVDTSSIGSALERLPTYLGNLLLIPENIKESPYVALVLGLLLIFFAVFLWQCLQKNLLPSLGSEGNAYGISREATNTFFIFSLCAITVIVLIIPCLYPRMAGVRPDLINLRYFNIVYIWAAAAFIFSVAEVFNRRRVLNLLIGLCSLLIILGSISSVLKVNSEKDFRLGTHAYHLIEEAKAAGLPLQNGLAPYFAARPTQVLLNDGNRVFGITGTKGFDLFPHHLWLRPYPGSAQIYNYVVINHALSSYNVSADILPAGYTIFKSENFPKVELFYYDNKNLDDAFRKKHKILMDKLGKGQ